MFFDVSPDGQSLQDQRRLLIAEKLGRLKLDSWMQGRLPTTQSTPYTQPAKTVPMDSLTKIKLSNAFYKAAPVVKADLERRLNAMTSTPDQMAAGESVREYLTRRRVDEQIRQSAKKPQLISHAPSTPDHGVNTTHRLRYRKAGGVSYTDEFFPNRKLAELRATFLQLHPTNADIDYSPHWQAVEPGYAVHWTDRSGCRHREGFLDIWEAENRYRMLANHADIMQVDRHERLSLEWLLCEPRAVPV